MNFDMSQIDALACLARTTGTLSEESILKLIDDWLELQRLLQAEKDARKVDAKKAIRWMEALLENGTMHWTELSNDIEKFKKIAEGE